MLRIENLHVSYGNNEILKNININFQRNKLYGIIGPNGAGKSTLLNTISRDVNKYHGDILLNNSNIKSFKTYDYAKNIAYMRQTINVKFPYTVKELVGMGRYIHDNNQESEDIVMGRIEENGLADLANKPIDKLSGGEVQRALFSKVLAQESDIILVDEGLSNADIYYKVHFFDMLKKEVEKGKTVIVVLHDLFLARKYCEELIIVHDGKIYDRGISENVLNRHSLKEVFRVNGDFKENALVLE